MNKYKFRNHIKLLEKKHIVGKFLFKHSILLLLHIVKLIFKVFLFLVHIFHEGNDLVLLSDGFGLGFDWNGLVCLVIKFLFFDHSVRERFLIQLLLTR